MIEQPHMELPKGQACTCPVGMMIKHSAQQSASWTTWVSNLGRPIILCCSLLIQVVSVLVQRQIWTAHDGRILP